MGVYTRLAELTNVGSTDFDGTGTAALRTQASHGTAIATGATSLTMSANVAVVAGEGVSGAGIAPGTLVAADSSGAATFTIDTATTGSIPAGTVLTFHPTTVTLSAADANILPGQPVAGAGIPVGAVVLSYTSGGPSIKLSVPITASLASAALTFTKGSLTVAKVSGWGVLYTACDNF